MPVFRRPSKEPLWKEEFSVLTSDERYVTRRQFTKFLTLASLGMFVGNLWIFLKSWFVKPRRFPGLEIAQVGEIPIRGVKLFTYPTSQDHCIMVRTSEDEYVAYSQKCTHLSCAVYYSAENDRLECPCHQGFFSIKDGSVLQGPPPRPLPQIVLEREAGRLIATRVKVS
ncbi:MAG TPA: ubiquinol-cytochrome c reductase iron-sulfur subunit [Candidatus Eisenbacteria bacterium]|jgi:nitrite reductase/ring-hydroxylating ferredoxin subunit|nr:ubiquinol-cytochrome c reductase iron-sulfur subunit [Candidatus Eisenbacteria bacterium]